jgi:hypothetical protein
MQKERFGLVFVKTGSIISGTCFFRRMSYPLALLPITVAILAAVRTLLRLAREFCAALSLLIRNRGNATKRGEK